MVKVVELPSSPLPADFNPLGGIAVIARNTWAAIQGRKALKIEWDHGPHATYDSAAYKAELEAAARAAGKVVRNEGDVDAALQSAAKRLDAEYYAPHLAQAPMEPPAATVRIADGTCEVWTCTQAPQLTRERVAKWLKLPVEKVTVHVTLLGGGFGRKSKPDYVIEAALLSKAMRGKPVKRPGPVKTTCAILIFIPCRWSGWKPAWMPPVKPWPGCTAPRRRRSRPPSAPTASSRCRWNWGWA